MAICFRKGIIVLEVYIMVDPVRAENERATGESSDAQVYHCNLVLVSESSLESTGFA